MIEYIIILACLSGIVVSAMVRENKRTGNHVCPIDGTDCEGVTKSQFNHIFGVPLELAGIAYYSIVGIFTLLSLSISFPPMVMAIVYLATFSAFLLSLLLTFIQAFRLKKWCFWCVGSAIMSIIIFIASTLSLLNNLPEIANVFAEYKLIFTILHLLGFALGLGGATFSDIFFFKFLKDFKVSHIENDTLETFSRFIWIGLFLLYFSGLGLFLGNYEALAVSTKFLLKVIVVLVITINGALLTLLISPNLTNIHFIGKLEAKKLHKLRRLAFALGGISVTSWYLAFVLGALKSIPLPFTTLLAIYILLLTIAVSVTQVIEHALTHARIEKQIEEK